MTNINPALALSQAWQMAFCVMLRAHDSPLGHLGFHSDIAGGTVEVDAVV
jgi:hypothetical protein